MTKKILFLSKGVSASSTRYRALQYFPLYKSHGYQPTHHTISGGLLPFISALFQAYQSDVTVLIRKTFPTPFFWLLRKVSKKLIFDFDDAIFCNTDGSHSKTRMSRFITSVKHADQVFAGNQYLYEVAKEHQTNTAVIPTSLATKKYDLGIKERNDKHFVLVWIGSKSTKKYIQGILPAIEKAAETIPLLQLKIIADFQLHSNSISIKNIPWSETTEANEVHSSHIGLGPLPLDNWTKGKCALKVLQYMSASLPVISSPTSANGYVVEHLESGYLAQNIPDWTTAILAAYDNRKSLEKMGQAGKQRVEREFDINTVFQSIIQLI